MPQGDKSLYTPKQKAPSSSYREVVRGAWRVGKDGERARVGNGQQGVGRWQAVGFRQEIVNGALTGGVDEQAERRRC
jgi:hypothetical protein